MPVAIWDTLFCPYINNIQLPLTLMYLGASFIAHQPYQPNSLPIKIEQSTQLQSYQYWQAGKTKVD